MENHDEKKVHQETTKESHAALDIHAENHDDERHALHYIIG
jgi:hypothetical protein